MRVSEYFGLGRTQAELDFVDVHVLDDTPLFVDPGALRQLPSTWAHECVALIQDFFQAVIDAIKAEDDDRAKDLLRGLREPNETHLGLSSGRSRGRALGPDSAEDVWDALSQSEATHTGLLIHLEDTALLVRGIGPDIVSDMATNLMRGPLIDYTVEAAQRYGILLAPQVDSGPLWSPETRTWDAGRYVELPVAENRKLLLVPKVIARKRLDYDTDEYLHDFILPYLEEQEISANTSLVRTIKYNGAKKVTKKDLIEKYGSNKDSIIRVTLDEPDLLDRYRNVKRTTPSPPLSHEDMVEPTGSDLPDWDALIRDVTSIEVGTAGASAYHKTVEKLLSAVFSPSLAMPILEEKLHGGRKRVDIAYTNAGIRDFFAWVAQHHPAANIYVECKNYTGDPGNPELDQLAGRFSPTRGKVGFLICRSFDDKELFFARCRDTSLDRRGFIIPLDDGDLAELVELRRNKRTQAIYMFLKTRFDGLT